MARLNVKEHGKGCMQNVGLIISAYDSSKFTTDNGKNIQYVSPRIHPDDERAVGQVVPELRFEPQKDGKSPKTSIAMYESQIEALKANSETFPLTTKDGEVVGVNYVTRADLMVQRQGDGPSYLMPNSKTFTKDPSLDATITPDGVSPLDRSYAMVKEAKQARDASKNAQVEIENQTQVEAGDKALDEPDLG